MASEVERKQRLEARNRAKILESARKLIGTKYSELDCSHMVHKVYGEAGLTYDYMTTELLNGPLSERYFKSTNEGRPGDLVLYSAHVGIYDPDGCDAQRTSECERVKSDMRVLSSRSGAGLGVEYGRSNWFGKARYLRWKEFSD